jgi:hypothetical protein
MANRYAVKSTSVTLAQATEKWHHQWRPGVTVFHMGPGEECIRESVLGVHAFTGWEVQAFLDAARELNNMSLVKGWKYARYELVILD